MNNIEEVIQVISIGLIVACFLLNTRCCLKAIELCKECLFILKNKAVINDEELARIIYKSIYSIMFQAYSLISDHSNAIEYGEKILHILRECGGSSDECNLSMKLAYMHYHQHKYEQAKQLWEKALVISKTIADRNAEATCCINLGGVFQDVGEYEKAREYFEKALSFYTEIGDREGEAKCYNNLGSVYHAVGEYGKAREYHEKSLAITIEIGVRIGEASCYSNLGGVYHSVGENEKAREYHEKALAIKIEIGDREGEANCYNNLGSVYHAVGEYGKARECHEKSLAITIEIGVRIGEASCYSNLGGVYHSVGEYEKAREYQEKALSFYTEIGDREGEATCYNNLGSVYHSVGEYEKARGYDEKALAIKTEIGDRDGEATCYGDLGSVYQSVGEYGKAREYHEKAIAIKIEIGDRRGEACYCNNLGSLYQSVGEYGKAIEHIEKALATFNDIGDRRGEASCYGCLGWVYELVGEYAKAEEHFKKSLVRRRKIGNRRGVGWSYHALGTLFHRVGKYPMAMKYLKSGEVIATKIGDKILEASSYGQKGVVLTSVGDYAKAKEYLEKALAIRRSLFHRAGEAGDCLHLGTVFCNLGECVKAEEYIKRALEISEEIGDVRTQFLSLEKLASLREKEGKIHEAISYFLPAIKKCEDLRGFLLDNDHLKISFSHCHIHSYRQLSALLCGAGNLNEALFVAELGRARALADLMSVQYSAEKQISANLRALADLMSPQYPSEKQILPNPQTRAGIEKFMDNERNCTCLYVSYFFDNIFLWIVKASGVTHFRNVNGKELIVQEGLAGNLDDIFASKSFRSFGILPKELCEDRSLNCIQPESKSSEDESREGLRFGLEDIHEPGAKMNLLLCYRLIIAPVVDFLEGPEVIIVPDRSLYNIPFATLPDEKGKCLSETFRIRVVPSLTTLKLIHDSPADYHSQTGALIVGNPDVGEVHLKGHITNISRLPCAEREAKMVGEMLGVKPLLGQEATKQAVLEVINSVSLIHFATHGDAEKGEIVLAPAVRIPNMRPQEEQYLLTMSDISKVQVRAKLVVLSCCYSARGHIKAEGAVGIARAFLGSGARSVLVALWAIDDRATEQLMSRFYKYLVRSKSASESLHEAMKRMRCKGKGYSHVSDWAPFILIGDNVTFDFANQGKFD